MRGLSFSNFVLIQDSIHCVGKRHSQTLKDKKIIEEMTKQIKMKSKQRFQD